MYDLFIYFPFASLNVLPEREEYSSIEEAKDAAEDYCGKALEWEYDYQGERATVQGKYNFLVAQR